MVASASNAREYLRSGKFRELFIRELGWDHYHQRFSIELSSGDRYTLTGQAEKRGMAVFLCGPDSNGQIPDQATRRKIERQAAKLVHEHIIIYLDEPLTTQVWQWVRREPGKPDRPREQTLHPDQSGDALLQRLQEIAVTLDEESDLDIVQIAGKVRAAFDVDKVTKKFYERFKAEHDRFLSFIEGIQAQGDREWYASLMLNRLMFVYFIQKKGFLDGDRDYLRNRLRTVQQRRGKGQFLSFYRYFLLRLFHEGLGQSDRTPALDDLLGKVPYLNGGLFDVHQLETTNQNIEIPDEAFERIFAFFEQYEWHLDTRPLRKDNEINPDVLGYIFEKYINQKQMGAYYTKEDITGYISKNTVIPYLFDAARKKCPIAFEPSGSVWSLLQEDPDRYIYQAVRKGADLDLPESIAAGVHDVAKRQDWNRPAATEFALPTETWREHVARRQRCYEVRKKLASGEIEDINDLVTYNLDIVQFAQNTIAYCEGPELLRALYKAIQSVTVLDPTCGSGAFLFAALNILEPLYDACLERMQGFVDDLDRSEERHSPRKFQDFRETLAAVEAHPNREYFILKSIILNNLYGVDIMEEAVEIAKLRLFLTLVAQVKSADQIEPLPDIDFNIRAGNTLVGFATYEEARRSIEGVTDERGAVQARMDYGGVAEKIRQRAEDVERLFEQFRKQQTEHGGEIKPEDKQELRRRLGELDLELDRYLASEYGVDAGKEEAFQHWRSTHQPFHWFVEFYRIMQGGGFDVIVGNPPYVVYTDAAVGYRLLDKDYRTFATKNLYAYVFERSVALAGRTCPIGLIIQLTVMSSERMAPLQDLLIDRATVLALPFPRRPESIFDGVEMPVAIILSLSTVRSSFATSRVDRFYAEERPVALNRMHLDRHCVRIDGFRIAKIGSTLERAIIEKVRSKQIPLEALVDGRSPHLIYYQEACRYWMKACQGVPFFKRNGVKLRPPHGRTLNFESSGAAAFVACVLNSSLFYWYYSTLSDCEHVNDTLVRGFPVPSDWEHVDWAGAASELHESLVRNARRKTIVTKQGHIIEYDEIKALHSKPIIDDIDRILAEHYAFTPEELDFIINYDIKYRMGQEAEE